MSSKKASQKTQATVTKRPVAAQLEAPASLAVETKAPEPEKTWVEVDDAELALLDNSPSCLYVDPQLLALAANGGEEASSDAFDIFGKMTPEERRLTRRAAIRLEEWVDSYLIGNGK